MRRRAAREAATVVLAAGIAAVSAGFAKLVRELIHRSSGWFYGDENVTDALRTVTRAAPAVLITVGILAARWLNARAQAWQPGRLGIEAIARSAQGQPPGPSLRATLLKSLATMAACVPGTSLGRESAILETGGALGCFAGRRTGLNGPALASAGVAAAFASAYHAPFGAVAYVGSHLGVWRDRRSLTYAVGGSLFADWLTVHHLGGHAIFPGTRDSVASLMVLGAVAVVPAFVGARLFVRLRDRLSAWSFGRSHPRTVLAGSIVVSVGIVLVAPLSAGNGMEALRHVAVSGSFAAAAALGIGKLVATSTTLNAKAPGGVVAPTLAVSAGWVLATYAVLERIGIDLPGSHWGGMIIGMAVGAAVGLHSPLMASVMVAEMCGQTGMIPFTAAGAFLAHRGVHMLDRFDRSRHVSVPAAFHPEDE